MFVPAFHIKERSLDEAEKGRKKVGGGGVRGRRETDAPNFFEREVC